MSGFSCELPLEVVKKILLDRYNVLDNYHKIWYNKENNTLVLEAVYDEARIETDPFICTSDSINETGR